MANAHLNGIDIFFERSGEGNRLLFLNGSGATLARTAPMTKMLAKHFDLAAHDQRGLGLTSIPDGPYTMSDYASDAAALADHLGWDTFSVIGISFGGMVAQELAVTVPERIERLALLVTSSGGAGGSSYPLHTLADLAPDELARVRLTLIDTRFTPEWLAEHPADQVFADAMSSGAKAIKSADVRRGERLQMQARSQHDVFERLGRISCPTLVVSGRFDGIAPPSNGEAIASRIPGAEFRLLDGGHAGFYQDPDGFPDVISFLKGRQGSRYSPMPTG